MADTALYYCALETLIQSVEEAVQKPEHSYLTSLQRGGSGIQSTASYQMDSDHSCSLTLPVVPAADEPRKQRL